MCFISQITLYLPNSSDSVIVLWQSKSRNNVTRFVKSVWELVGWTYFIIFTSKISKYYFFRSHSYQGYISSSVEWSIVVSERIFFERVSVRINRIILYDNKTYEEKVKFISQLKLLNDIFTNYFYLIMNIYKNLLEIYQLEWFMATSADFHFIGLEVMIEWQTTRN